MCIYVWRCMLGDKLNKGEQNRKRDRSLALMLTYRLPDAH